MDARPSRMPRWFSLTMGIVSVLFSLEYIRLVFLEGGQPPRRVAVLALWVIMAVVWFNAWRVSGRRSGSARRPPRGPAAE